MPDKHGYISLSMGNTYEMEAISHADLVILEINPNYPRTFGDHVLHISDVDFLIESDYKVPTIPSGESSEKDEKIGYYIADYIDCLLYTSQVYLPNGTVWGRPITYILILIILFMKPTGIFGKKIVKKV